MTAPHSKRPLDPKQLAKKIVDIARGEGADEEMVFAQRARKRGLTGAKKKSPLAAG